MSSRQRTSYLDLFLVHFPLSWRFTGLPITDANRVPLRADNGKPELIAVRCVGSELSQGHSSLAAV